MLRRLLMIYKITRQDFYVCLLKMEWSIWDRILFYIEKFFFVYSLFKKVSFFIFEENFFHKTLIQILFHVSYRSHFLNPLYWIKKNWSYEIKTEILIEIYFINIDKTRCDKELSYIIYYLVSPIENLNCL